jgi:hypothetical protein
VEKMISSAFLSILFTRSIRRVERRIVDNELTTENTKCRVLPGPLEKPIYHELAFLGKKPTEEVVGECRASCWKVAQIRYVGPNT